MLVSRSMEANLVKKIAVKMKFQEHRQDLTQVEIFEEKGVFSRFWKLNKHL